MLSIPRGHWCNVEPLSINISQGKLATLRILRTVQMADEIMPGLVWITMYVCSILKPIALFNLNNAYPHLRFHNSPLNTQVTPTSTTCRMTSRFCRSSASSISLHSPSTVASRVLGRWRHLLISSLVTLGYDCFLGLDLRRHFLPDRLVPGGFLFREVRFSVK